MARSSNTIRDTKNLVQKAGESTWYVRLAVPVDVQKIIGRKVFIKSLQTASLTEAQRRRGVHLTTWWAQIEAARKSKQLPEGWQSNVVDAIETVNSMFQDQKRAIIGEVIPPLPPINLELEARLRGNPRLVEAFETHVKQRLGEGLSGKLQLQDELAEFHRRLAEKLMTHRYAVSADQKSELVSLIADPASHRSKSPITKSRLTTYREFREKRGGAPKHVDQQVGKMERLSTFLKDEGLVLNFDTVDAWLKSLDRAPATLGQYLMAGTAFWKWAMKYDTAWREEYKDKVNPFVGHALPQGGGSETAGKDREIYTRDDTIKLHQAALNGGDKPLADLITLGWYTGARIEELCRLNKESVITVDGIRCLDFPRSKSKASKRVVPIHTSLLPVVDRLLENTVDTFLVPTQTANHYGKRSHAISKAFGRLRTAAGFSKLHVFHSFRHTVVTELIRADVPDALAKELVGHETGSVTHDVYSKGASTVQKLAAISKLPTLTLASVSASHQ
ncbi:integrase [Pseudomonas agarici]|uniref:Integrase n=1 Tax=Pseudomonas agarici TaxID=46677 RepID=A0A0X1T6I5_PSEAA|nr:integrase [Pseudomonas agarici]